MSFNNVLRMLRMKKGLTQNELAKLTGLTRSAIGMYEKGEREPKYEVLELLADFFNVDMNTLLDKTPPAEIVLTPAEQRHLDKYRQLSTASRHTIDDQIDYLLYKEEQDEELQAKKDSQCSA